jgi:hypothetical protein
MTMAADPRFDSLGQTAGQQGLVDGIHLPIFKEAMGVGLSWFVGSISHVQPTATKETRY